MINFRCRLSFPVSRDYFSWLYLSDNVDILTESMCFHFPSYYPFRFCNESHFFLALAYLSLNDQRGSPLCETLPIYQISRISL